MATKPGKSKPKKSRAKNFPAQTRNVGKEAAILFGSTRHMGVIVRDDAVKPFRTILKLNNGRYLLSTECQYQF